MNGTCNSTIFWVLPPPGALGRNIIKSQLLSQFQIFLKQTSHLFSQMKDIKTCKMEFTLGLGLWGAGGQKFNFLNMVMWHKVDELKPRIH